MQPKLKRSELDGLELLDPGVVTCSAWRPDPEHPGITDKVSEFGGVARKL